MNFLKHCVFFLLATIVTLLIFTIAWITYILVSPLQAMKVTDECWKESQFNAKRRKMESKR